MSDFKKQTVPRWLMILIIVFMLICGSVYFFQSSPGTTSYNSTVVDYGPASMESIQDGNILAHRYCVSCHLFPEPALLNRYAWKKLLPKMGIRLGIRSHSGQSYDSVVKAPDLNIPPERLIGELEWQHILDYYLNTAPMRLAKQQRSVKVLRNLAYFKVKSPSPAFDANQLLGTMVRIDSSVKPSRIFVANGRTNKLYLFDHHLNALDSAITPGPVVDLTIQSGKIYITVIGKELGATSDKFGEVKEIHIRDDGKITNDKEPIFTNLARPVETIATDVNDDGKADFVICEFGNLHGDLCWMENKGNGNFEKHYISELPGAIMAKAEDIHHNNAPDFWVLFTQGDESICRYTNDGKGNFSKETVLKFPPVQGSSSFDLADVNGDGLRDIVYTCGDNGDGTYDLKPYHGVYVYLNNGKGKFEKKYFFPVNGCYKAITGDFDGNGTTDIATISLYTDPKQPSEGFIYLKNTGGMHFKPYSLPAKIKFERAITMAAGDIDGDGGTDLILGNSFFDFGPFGKNIKEPLFYLLKNITVKKRK